MELHKSFDETIQYIRNDLYFIFHNNIFLIYIKALLALSRDLIYCLFLPRKLIIQAKPNYIFCVSLLGSSGWSALDPYYQCISPQNNALIINHPRIKGQKKFMLPVGPTLRGWLAFFKAFRIKEKSKNPRLKKFIVRLYAARATLWVEVWKSTLSQLGDVKKIILHNDFDMFSSAAIRACNGYEVKTVCIQHGLPTDEFFPTLANYYLVWGDSSAKVFANSNITSTKVYMGRLMKAPVIDASAIDNGPKEIALVSQTHTPIFGPDLYNSLLKFVTDVINLTVMARYVDFSIFLHPEECRVGHPYKGKLRRYCSRPPNRKMIRASGDNPILVIGFCSTALIESALSGNYVLGLDWSLNSSFGAYEVGAPPIRVKNGQEALLVFDRLNLDLNYRRYFIKKQNEWIVKTFKILDKTEAFKLIDVNP